MEKKKGCAASKTYLQNGSPNELNHNVLTVDVAKHLNKMNKVESVFSTSISVSPLCGQWCLPANSNSDVNMH